MIPVDEAMEVARLRFRERFAEQHIPAEVAERLSVGSLRDGIEWVVEVRLLAQPPNPDGLKSDLSGPPSTLIATIRVDSKTGRTILIEAPKLPW